MIIENLTVDGIECRNVEVQERIPADILFGSDAAEYETTATHIGFATIDDDDIRVLYGTQHADGAMTWEFV